MIISHGRRFIFIHIPKTGGTAMALALEGRAMKDDLMMGDTPKATKRRRRLKDVQTSGRLWKHSGLSDIEGLVTEDEIKEFFTFTLVRNPWDRMVSYYHWARVQDFDHPAVSCAKAHDFQGFVADAGVQRSVKANSYGRYMTTLSGDEVCTQFIRLECFSEDAQPLFDHLGFDLELPRVNRSNRSADYRVYYDDRAAETVGEICATDITRFGYTY